MKKHQTGEVMLATMVVMMIVMMIVVWSSRGHMGMMGQDAVQAEKPESSEQQTKAEQPHPPASKESPELQR